MKYAIVIPDGCADEPQASLGGKSPLQAANIPTMNALAKVGIVGRANNVPIHLPPGSDVANLSLLGYDPNVCFTGRAPLEAAAQGIELGPRDWAIRCNLVTVENQKMRSFTADHVSTPEATTLLADLQSALALPHLQFFPGVSYRNLLVFRGEHREAPFSRETRTTPPHDLTDKSILRDYPQGPGCDVLSEIMSRSSDLFANHPVNQARRAAGRLPATNVWLWGLGWNAKLESFSQRYGKHGQMITAVDLLRGLATMIGWGRIEVPGATGYLDTDYAAKGRYAIEALRTTDIVCVHVEATDEASHEGNVAAKIKALEEIDRHIVKPLWDALTTYGEYRILVSPDHPTPVRTKTHSHGFVPFVIAGSGVASAGQTSYDEVTALASSLKFEEGWKLMNYFVNEIC